MAVAHDGSVVALDNAGDNISCREFIHIVLGGVVKNMAELKLPVVELVVDSTLVCLLYKYLEVTCLGVDIKVLDGKLVGGPCSNDNFYSLFGHALFK